MQHPQKKHYHFVTSKTEKKNLFNLVAFFYRNFMIYSITFEFKKCWCSKVVVLTGIPSYAF